MWFSSFFQHFTPICHINDKPGNKGGNIQEERQYKRKCCQLDVYKRQELYKADEFVHISSDALRETLGDEVAALYTASKTADTETTQNPSGLDLTADKASYAAMQIATQEGTSSGVREQAAAALTQLTEQVETRIEQLTQQISQTQDALTAAADAQTSAASRCV